MKEEDKTTARRSKCSRDRQSTQKRVWGNDLKDYQKNSGKEWMHRVRGKKILTKSCKI